MRNITKIALAWELNGEEVSKLDIAQKLGIGRATLYRWLAGIKEAGDLELFIDHYLAAKKSPRKKRKVDGLLKARIWSLREKYELRTRWKKNQKRGPIPEANKPREVVQMDTVDFGEVFAFSGIDIFTREVDVLLRSSLTSRDGLIFLKIAMRRRFDSFVETIQTDGGSEFEDNFANCVLQYAKYHRIARPYKKNEQAFIEAFNRSLRKECLGWGKYKVKELPLLRKEVESYLEYYHKRRPHISLGMRSPEEYRLSHI